MIIQKFGGTSVATEESREYVYKKIEEAFKTDNKLVIVISAMGRKGAPYASDTLIDLVKSENNNVSGRELDTIYSCGEVISGCIITAGLQKRGYKAVYLTGWQIGILTEDRHIEAKIVHIDTSKIEQYLSDGYIVVVAGGQGATQNGDVTAIGRGGSDTTAAALGARLKANKVEIYTDVDGIMTGDPRIIENVKIIDKISYENCLSMAENGAKVIHPRAVSISSRSKNTDLFLKSTFSDHPGTLINFIDQDKQLGTDIKTTENVFAITSIEDLNLIKIKKFSLEQSGDIIKSLEKYGDMEKYYISIFEEEIILICKNSFLDNVIFSLSENNIIPIVLKDRIEIRLIGQHLNQSKLFLTKVIEKLSTNNISSDYLYSQENYIGAIVHKENYIKAINSLHDIILESAFCMK